MEGSWKVPGEGLREQQMTVLLKEKMKPSVTICYWLLLSVTDLADGPDEGEDEADVVRERLPRAVEELGHVLRLRPRTHAAHTISSAPMGICR